ncbi:MAG: type I methionyl aminopeptidase [Candidatus Omnitrophota bacterium]|jgi:methionyl aminopeptidase|nr:MAG: type I methionyl aminopeptidase [Candidatus Omnitrophota bacterium]
MIPLKSKEDIHMMGESGKILSRIIRSLRLFVSEGMTTKEIDAYAETLIKKESVISAFKGYRGYPANICTSVNDEVVHGIPSERVLLNGDILSLDVGINYKGYFSDAALTIPIGIVSGQIKKLLEVTEKSLKIGIEKVKANNHLYDISYAIQEYVEKNGFSIVREFVGHGIGKSLHEEPEIPNFGRKGTGPLLTEGMVFAVEPMVNMGAWEVEIAPNGWTALTKDRMASAHFEHTVAITDRGTEILTA